MFDFKRVTASTNQDGEASAPLYILLLGLSLTFLLLCLFLALCSFAVSVLWHSHLLIWDFVGAWFNV